MDLFPLISIPLLYLFIALIKPYVQPKLPFNVCAICVSVSLTWLALIVLMILGISFASSLLPILMGMSVAGVMYKIEAYFKIQKLRHFWAARLLIVLGGLYSVDFFLREDWNALILLIVTILVLVFSIAFLFQGATHEEVMQEGQDRGLKRSLIKKLEDCC